MTENYIEVTVSKTIKGILSVSDMDDVRYGIYLRWTTMTENIYLGDGFEYFYRIFVSSQYARYKIRSLFTVNDDDR